MLTDFLGADRQGVQYEPFIQVENRTNHLRDGGRRLQGMYASSYTHR